MGYCGNCFWGHCGDLYVSRVPYSYGDYLGARSTDAGPQEITKGGMRMIVALGFIGIIFAIVYSIVDAREKINASKPKYLREFAPDLFPAASRDESRSFTRDTFLRDPQEIRGIDRCYRKEDPTFWAQEHTFYLIREPQNKADPNAIRVFDARCNLIAYLARERARELAPIMDELQIRYTAVNIPGTYRKERWGSCQVMLTEASPPVIKTTKRRCVHF